MTRPVSSWRVSDEQIKQAIVAMPEFAENGKFSNDRYLQLIRVPA
jgi:peptidyl-prolyl cis-trans isomerase D